MIAVLGEMRFWWEKVRGEAGVILLDAAAAVFFGCTEN